MIKVNLAGKGYKKPKAEGKVSVPTSFRPNFTPILLILIALGFAGGGYYWYRSLSNQVEDLNNKIKEAQAQKTALENVIKQDQIYESRKKALENRVKVIEGLQKNQISPVVALDQLSEAVDRTKFVWLSSLDQTNTTLTMNGIGTSLNAIADFYTNLTATGYFKNIDISNASDAAGNYTFSLKCEFSPPQRTAPSAGDKSSAGGN
jgi:Tfp pilus assembly protein PilN